MKRACFASAVLLSLAGAMVAFLFGKDRGVSDPNSRVEFPPWETNIQFDLKTRESNQSDEAHSSVAHTKENFSLLELEQFGRVPNDANERTWRLCEKTSWWGRRLDASSFWSNRVVWLSPEAEAEAHVHGRGYPPIPPGNTLFLDRSDSDGSNPVVTWESRGRSYYSSERENAYWDWFQKTMPRPPEAIDWMLNKASEEWLSIKHETTMHPVGLTIPLPSVENRRSELANRYICLGFPKEAFSATALDWEYVCIKRQERKKIANDLDEFRRNMLLEDFNQHLTCPSSLVESEPSGEELRITRGWRVKYLRRLRREGTDESYIEAYKKAWNLSEDELKEAAQ